MNNLTQDSIISTLADADRPLPSRSIAKAIGAEHVGKVTAMLTEMVRMEVIERARGGAYQLRDFGERDFQARSTGTRREILSTDKVALAVSAKRRKERKQKTVVDKKKHPVDFISVEGDFMTLEKAERQADEYKSFGAALHRLESTMKKSAVGIPDLPNAEVKRAMLCKMEAIMEESIATECRELRKWMGEILKRAGIA